MHICVWACIYVTVYMSQVSQCPCEVHRTTWSIVSLFLLLHVFQDGTQVVRLGVKYLYSLSHLYGSNDESICLSWELLHTWTDGDCDLTQDLNKIKAMKFPDYMGGGAGRSWNHATSWGVIANWWLLGKDRSVFFKDMSFETAPMLQEMFLCPYTYWQHEMNLVDY